MKPTQKRLLLGVALICCSLVLLGALMYGMSAYVSFYQTPTQALSARTSASGTKKWRIGGYVRPGSISRLPDGTVRFAIYDNQNHIWVHYKGILPQLFREYQGVVLDGIFSQHHFIASRVLSKHDEVYTSKPRMPGPINPEIPK